MGTKLYVGGISFKATEDELKEIFAAVGEVESVKIITDSYTGQAKGFGFVEMASEEDAKKAIESLNGTTFMNRSIAVNEARPPKPRERKSFGGDNRGGGGFGRGRGGFGGGGGSRDSRPGRGRR